MAAIGNGLVAEVISDDCKQSILEAVDPSECIADAVAASCTLIPTVSSATLQSLLTAPLNNPTYVTHGDNMQIITLSDPASMLSAGGAGRLWQVVPSATNPEIATIIAVTEMGDHDYDKVVTADGVDEALDSPDPATVEVTPVHVQDGPTAIMMPPPPTPAQHPVVLPPHCPAWAARLKNCEVIGDSYRGYVESEVELDLLLTYHKQQTLSFWGTRQSPSPAKPSTRLMWKSQYVPFDGTPFVNAGSRAVVMECQYGPRRKGVGSKKLNEPVRKSEFKQTCPARIYIKKVKKFPDFAVDVNIDKKYLKSLMDKSFHDLKQNGLDCWGQERYYVQLPTQKAHDFHGDAPAIQVVHRVPDELENDTITRLDQRVAQRLRDIVSSGETRVYAVRKQLRSFVTKELATSEDNIPERHDLTYFPTVHDLKNHIHQALKDIDRGSLPLTGTLDNVEIMPNGDRSNPIQDQISDYPPIEQSSVWPASLGTARAVPEAVTVTLTQNAGEDGHHTIARIETTLSDGTTQISSSLTPETASLLAKLHPGLFPSGSMLQFQSLPLSQHQEGDLQQLNDQITNMPEEPISQESELSLEQGELSVGQLDQIADITEDEASPEERLLSGNIPNEPMEIGTLEIVNADGATISDNENADLLTITMSSAGGDMAEHMKDSNQL